MVIELLHLQSWSHLHVDHAQPSSHLAQGSQPWHQAAAPSLRQPNPTVHHIENEVIEMGCWQTGPSIVENYFPTGIFSLAWFTGELHKSVGQHRQMSTPSATPPTGDDSQVPQCGCTEKQGKMLSPKSRTGPNRHSSHISCFTILNCTLHLAFSLPPQTTGITRN